MLSSDRRLDRFESNSYKTGGRTGSLFWTWGGSVLDWNQWQAIPEDATGTA